MLPTNTTQKEVKEANTKTIAKSRKCILSIFKGIKKTKDG
jgi:hypothetical protein